MTECFKALIDRVRRMEPFTNRFLKDKRCMLVAVRAEPAVVQSSV